MEGGGKTIDAAPIAFSALGGNAPIESSAPPAAAPRTISPFKADLARYPRKPWLKEQSLWAVAIYRFGRWNDTRKPSLTKKLLDKVYWLVYRVVETLTGITMPKMVQIGPGLRIHHYGGIIIHQNTKIGANCTLRQGITIGNRYNDGPAPVLEDDVEVGAAAQILGDVRIGRGARIGAMSLVLCDVPPRRHRCRNPRAGHLTPAERRS